MTEQLRIQRYKTAMPVKFFGLASITPVGEGTIIGVKFTSLPKRNMDLLITWIMKNKE
jgi:hypothetical protein